ITCGCACRRRIRTPTRTRTRCPTRCRIHVASTRAAEDTPMSRTAACAFAAAGLLLTTGYDEHVLTIQARGVSELVADLSAGDPVVRAGAACALRDLGDAAVDAIQPLANMRADAAPVEATVCARRWSRGNPNDLTSPGEQAATALVAIGTRAFQPVLAA